MNKSIELQNASSRFLLAAAALVCLIVTSFFVKWCFANAIATRAPNIEVAELAINLAPNDPQTHYALGVLDEKTFLAEDLAESLNEFEKAVALAPHDYRLWLALGKSREKSGNAAGAELAVRRALALAPNYAQLQWTLGNILLRQGKTTEAFAEIRRAAESGETYRLPAISTAWQIFGGDTAQIKQNLGDSDELKSALAVFLAKEKRFDEAIEVWNSLTVGENKNPIKANGEELLRELMTAKKYRYALKVQTQINNNDAESFSPAKVFNGGFETDIKREQASVFDWQIADGVQPQIGFDDKQKTSGERSLVVIFNSTDGKDFRQIAQTVAIETSGRYVLEMSYKSNLKTAAGVHWEILDASDDKILATANLNPNSDWTKLTTEFVVPENTQAVTFRLVRDACKSIICPITGKVWFDDFSIHQ